MNAFERGITFIALAVIMISVTKPLSVGVPWHLVVGLFALAIYTMYRKERP